MLTQKLISTDTENSYTLPTDNDNDSLIGYNQNWLHVIHIHLLSSLFTVGPIVKKQML